MTDQQQNEADELAESGYELVHGTPVPGDHDEPDLIISAIQPGEHGVGSITTRLRVEPDGNVIYRNEDHAVGSLEDLRELAEARRLVRAVGERHQAPALTVALDSLEELARDVLGLDLDVIEYGDED